MKKYQVYGIGNALVDREFEVEDSFLKHETLQKGVMTLVDAESQATILERVTASYPLKKQAGGGSAANAMFAVSQFGGKAFYSCKVANDEAGSFYLNELGHHNIETNLDQDNREDGVSGQCLVLVSSDAERTMLTNLGISETLSREQVDEQALAAAEYLYIEGYLVTSDSARDAAIHARETAERNGVKTAITLSDPTMVQYFRGGLESMIGEGVDLLFCNEVEAQSWTGKDDIREAAEALKQTARQFVITLGPRGALLFDGQSYIEVEPHVVKAVDTNGAGDMFAGAFLYAVSAGHDFATAGKLASHSAATVVSHFGPRLSREQHQELLQQVTGSSEAVGS